jgi:hypothetical protein
VQALEDDDEIAGRVEQLRVIEASQPPMLTSESFWAEIHAPSV